MIMAFMFRFSDLGGQMALAELTSDHGSGLKRPDHGMENWMVVYMTVLVCIIMQAWQVMAWGGGLQSQMGVCETLKRVLFNTFPLLEKAGDKMRRNRTRETCLGIFGSAATCVCM